MISFAHIQPGTLIRNKGSGNVYIVTEAHGNKLVVVRTILVMNPSEWEIVPVSEPAVNPRFAELESDPAAEPMTEPAQTTERDPVVVEAIDRQVREALGQAKAPEPEWRRFEYIGGTSRKFWEICLDGNKYITRWGRIGTEGSLTVKEFDSARQAAREHDRIIESKVAKGYRPVTTRR